MITASFMTGPGAGEITIRMDCEHGTDELAFKAALDDVQAITAQASTLQAQHWQSFGCQCEIGVLINGEDPIQ